MKINKKTIWVLIFATLIIALVGCGYIQYKLIAASKYMSDYVDQMIREKEARDDKHQEDLRWCALDEMFNDLESYIRTKAREAGVDENKAVRIAKAESYDDLRNGCHIAQIIYPSNRSGPPMIMEDCRQGCGIYKIVPSTWTETLERMGEDLNQNCLNPFLNIRAGIFLQSQGEYWRWSQSEHNWNLELKVEKTD